MRKVSFTILFIFFLSACSVAQSNTDPESGGEAAAPAVPTDTNEPESRPADTAVPALEAAATPTTAAVVAATIEQPASPVPAPTEVNPAADSAAETDPAGPRIEEVTIPGAAALNLHATQYIPGADGVYPGVILLHMLGSNRQVWDETGFAAQLLDNGFAVLALDMRGHGQTGGTREWELSEADMQFVYDYFSTQPQVDGEATAVVGGSIGANMALITGANIPAVNTVVLLSPGLDYRGVTTADRIAEMGERPILIIVSEEDGYAASSSRSLQEAAGERAELIVYNGAGHGTNMFAGEAALAGTLLTWLDEKISR